MKRSAVGTSIALGLGFVLAVGLAPGCNCNGHAAGGDGGPGLDAGTGPDGSTSGDGGLTACGDNDPSCTAVCVGPTCAPPSMFPLPSDNPPDPHVGSDGVNRDPNTGYIILDQSHAAFDYLWIADDVDYGAGMVSKISTKPFATAPTYREVARYASVTCQSDPVNGSKEGAVIGETPPANLCADGVHGCCSRSESLPGANGKHQPINLQQNRPSRTAVDFNGDVWVANRAHLPTSYQSSATKIANDPSECIDRNHDGKIETSSDVNGDGIIETDCNGDNIADDASTVCSAGQPKEFWGLDDECILFTTNTGPVGQWGRPLALGQGSVDYGPADAWAGTFLDGMFYRIDGSTGLIKTSVKIQNEQGVASNPYGAAIDQFGILWAPNEGESQPHLFYFDTNNPSNQGMVTPPAGLGGVSSGFYGIAIDGFKANGQVISQVWMGNVGQSGAYRYRPVRNAGFAGLATGTWARAEFPAGSPSQGRGIAVDNRTPTSFVWVALDGYANSPQLPGALGRIPSDIPDGVTTLTANDLFSTTQYGTLGAGVAIDLNIWGVNQQSSSASHFTVDPMGVVSPSPDVISLDDKPTAAETFCHNPTGGQCKPHPYTYSDFTGFGLRNFTNPHGSYTWEQVGCGPMRTKWLKIIWDADTPLATSITARVRSADDEVSLQSATWYGAFTSSPADLSQVPGPIMPNPSGYLQVEFDLTTTDKSSTPALKSFQVVYECLSQLG